MDEMYIKMCREATEIQEGWKPKIGDNAWDDLDHDLYVISTLEEAFGLISFIHWLPRQEDLQEIIVNTYEHLGLKFYQRAEEGYMWMRLMDQFFTWYENVNNDLFKQDINIMWLRFAMEEVYHKRWNSETNKWESLNAP